MDLLANGSNGSPLSEPERIKSIRSYPTRYPLNLIKVNIKFLRACPMESNLTLNSIRLRMYLVGLLLVDLSLSDFEEGGPAET